MNQTQPNEERLSHTLKSHEPTWVDSSYTSENTMRIGILYSSNQQTDSTSTMPTHQHVRRALKGLCLDPVVINGDRPCLFDRLKVEQISVLIICAKGQFYEDGQLQGLCDWIKLPYLGSGRAASTLCQHPALLDLVHFGCQATYSEHVLVQPDDDLPDYPQMAQYLRSEVLDLIPVVAADPWTAKKRVRSARYFTQFLTQFLDLQGAVMIQPARSYTRQYRLIVHDLEAVPCAMTLFEAQDTSRHLTSAKGLSHAEHTMIEQTAVLYYRQLLLQGVAEFHVALTPHHRCQVLHVHTLPSLHPKAILAKSFAEQDTSYPDMLMSLVNRALHRPSVSPEQRTG